MRFKYGSCATITTLLFLFILGARSALDELISARCQAKCLRELELRVKNQTDIRRQLRHEILNLCREDRNCSSCLLPCNENFESDQRCALNVCKSAPSQRSCEDSCVVLEKISKRKPGQCAQPAANFVATECFANCNTDSDCKEAERCCTRGCSRMCIMPTFPDDNRLLPIPENIVVQERKRKRSAVIRWVMKKMSPAHTATNSNLYVIQWRWGIQKDPETMTPWQTIVVKNKMYAILKHVLSSGRYYIFRVASVNTHGSAGFSKPSLPFKLTKEVRAPGPPLNLTVADEQFDASSKLWTVQMSWQPPVSELPLKDYVLTYWRSSLDGVELYERQMGQKAALVQRQDDTEDEEDENEQSTGQDRKSTILPSYSTRATLSEGLQAASVYVVELYANVDSTEGQLRGESTIHVLRTRTSSSDPVSTSNQVDLPPLLPSSYYDTNVEIKSNRQNPREQPNQTIGQKLATEEDKKTQQTLTDDSTIFRAEIQPAYVLNGNLRTAISWLDHPKCTSERRDFNIRVQSVRCAKQMSIEQLVGGQCIAQLEQLHFSCEYLVEVRDVGDGQLITRIAFSTAPCSQTPSSDNQALDCRKYDKLPSLRCLPISATDSQKGGIECEWQGFSVSAQELVGYRTALTSSLSSSANVSIVSGLVRVIRFEKLEDGADYTLKVQALTTSGLGQQAVTEFRTGASGSFLQEIDRGNSMKLPFEATYSSANSNYGAFKLSSLFFIIFLLRRFDL